MGAILSTPLIGANTDRRTATAEFVVGTNATAAGNTAYTYCGPATGPISAGVCTLTPSTFTVTSAAGSHTCDAAFATGDYGWVRKTVSPF